MIFEIIPDALIKAGIKPGTYWAKIIEVLFLTPLNYNQR